MFREPFPILHVSHVERSVALYTEAFGFELGFAGRTRARSSSRS